MQIKVKAGKREINDLPNRETLFSPEKETKKNHRAEKVIILTGYPDLNEKFSKMMGADEYVEKPVDLKALEVILGKYAVRENSSAKN